jgi:uncharacterized membrane protein
MNDKKGFSLITYPNNLVVGITIVASFFSFFHIGQKSIWIDEGISVLLSKLPWRDFWAVLSSMELNMWFYSLLLKLWIFFGDSEYVIRSLSALFSIASIPVLYMLAMRLFGVHAGLITISLVSVNAFFIEYAQEARGYSLVYFLVVLSSYLFVRVTEDPGDKKTLYGYIIVSTLSVYSHLFAALILLAQALSVPFLPASKFRIRQLLFANLLIGVLLIPYAFLILTVGGEQISWVLKPSVSQLIDLLMDLSGDAGHVKYVTIVFLLPCSVTLVHAFVAFLRNKRSVDTWRYVFIILILVVPILVSYGVSFKKPVFLNRYLIVSLPGLIMLAGVGISLIKDKQFIVILLVLLMALLVRSTITQYYPKEKEENNRAPVFYVFSQARQGDGILFYKGGAMISFEYYWEKLNPPPDLLDSVYPWKFGQYKYNVPPPNLNVSFLESLKDHYERIWVVFRHEDTDYRYIVTSIEKHYQIEQQKKYPAIHLYLYVKK